LSTLPVTVNLEAYRGDTWSQSFAFKLGTNPIDLTGASVSAWMRDPGGVTDGLDVAIEDAPGTVTLRLPVPVPPPNAYVYDIEVTDAADVVTTWVRGRLIVRRDVTNELPDD
jgi:hypothetical protein